MMSRNGVLVVFTTFILILFVVNLGLSQVKKEEKIFYSGIITSMAKDHGFIVVSGENIFISFDTKIVNEKGKVLKIEDLRPELYVAIEGVPDPRGFLARKIVVRKPPEV